MKEDLERYLELAKICKAVYAGPVNQKRLSYKQVPIRDQIIVHGSFGRGFCRLFWNDNTLIVAFRGTRETVDWGISNLKMFPVFLKNCDMDSKKIRVHKGFQKTLYFKDKTTGLKGFKAVLKHIDKLGLLSNREVVIIGHSLGAAIATLFIVKLRAKMPDIVEKQLEEIVLFGSPAVGLRNFKNFYGELSNKTIRIINGSDAVPFTPPMFYYHIGNEIWIRKGQIKKNTSWISRLRYALKLPMKNFISDHGMKSYIESIKMLVKTAPLA